MKLTEYRGETNLTCYAYSVCSPNSHEVALPHAVNPKNAWSVSTGNGFELQSAVNVTLCDGKPVPANINQILEDKQSAIRSLLTRPPKAGSFALSGATGPRAYMVNGLYEPVDGEMCNDMPVYRSKDASDYWLEYTSFNGTWKCKYDAPYKCCILKRDSFRTNLSACTLQW